MFERFINPKIEKTMALRTLVGQNLPMLYFRDKNWIKELLPKVFSKDNMKLYLATWEGYLTQNLYSDLFKELLDYYEYAISLTKKDYTPRKYFRDLDEGLAQHIALAFIYYEGFDISNPLIKLFFENSDVKRRGHFVNFVGRHSIGRERFDFEEQGIKTQKFVDFWEWRLENSDDVGELKEKVEQIVDKLVQNGY